MCSGARAWQPSKTRRVCVRNATHLLRCCCGLLRRATQRLFAVRKHQHGNAGAEYRQQPDALVDAFLVPRRLLAAGRESGRSPAGAQLDVGSPAQRTPPGARRRASDAARFWFSSCCVSLCVTQTSRPGRAVSTHLPLDPFK